MNLNEIYCLGNGVSYQLGRKPYVGLVINEHLKGAITHNDSSETVISRTLSYFFLHLSHFKDVPVIRKLILFLPELCSLRRGGLELNYCKMHLISLSSFIRCCAAPRM